MKQNIIIAGLLTALLLSCGSSGGSDPVDPSILPNPSLAASTGGSDRYFLGLWKISIPEDHQSADVVPLRAANMHLNALYFLEQEPCTDCLFLTQFESLPANELSFRMSLTHPYSSNVRLNAFDVRGIFIAGSDYLFPEAGVSTAWGNNLPVIKNPSGYTTLFNPTDFPEDSPASPILKYITGKYSINGDFTATLNPFITFGYWLERCMFEVGHTMSSSVILRLPDGPIQFGYAVDASWMKVDGEINNPLIDFPPEANCPEAYLIDIEVCGDLKPETGSSQAILVDVYDHQGLDTIESVTIECPDLFDGVKELVYKSQLDIECWRFTGIVENELGADYGEYPILVRVIDTQLDKNFGAVDAWDIQPFRIKKGWVRTYVPAWYPACSHGMGIDLDDDGNIYTVGMFTGPVDFDPDCDEEWQDSGDDMNLDAYLAKLNSDGEYQWAVSWGTDWIPDWASDVAVDSVGNIYVTGIFMETADFDPGPDVEEITAYDDKDIFLSKFNPDGELIWVLTWGGDSADYAESVSVDDAGNVYVTGFFPHKVDFDPGPGSAIIDGGGAFLSKFYDNGMFQWVRVWDASGLAVETDETDGVYVAGAFNFTVDFDPGSGIDEHTASGWEDAYVTKFDADGNHEWAHSWGGEGSDRALGVTADASGNVWVTGFFEGTSDFDPGVTADIHASNGEQDAYLTKFNSYGGFVWAGTWGDIGWERGVDVAVRGEDVYVIGNFAGTVDFDPGPGVHEYDLGYGGMFLTKFDISNDHIWAVGWGGPESLDEGDSVAIDSNGCAFATGRYHGRVDFDPGPLEDYQIGNGNTDTYVIYFPADGMW